MEVKVLAPGMEDGEEPGFQPQAIWVGRNGEQSFGDHAEEHVVGDLLVVEGNGGDLLGEGEDHVKVCGGQHLGSALLDPLGACRALALGTMAVAAGAIAGVRVLALVAPFDDAAQ